MSEKRLSVVRSSNDVQDVVVPSDGPPGVAEALVGEGFSSGAITYAFEKLANSNKSISSPLNWCRTVAAAYTAAPAPVPPRDPAWDRQRTCRHGTFYGMSSALAECLYCNGTLPWDPSYE